MKFLSDTALKNSSLELDAVKDVTITGEGDVPGLLFGSRTGYPNTVLKSVNITGDIESIGRRAFYDCEALEKVTLPESLVTIGDEAFGGCSKLSEIVLPEGLKTIEYNAFGMCDFSEITLPAGIESLDQMIFSGCKKLGKVYFGGTLEEWEAVEKHADWCTGAYFGSGLNVICSDGEKWERKA